MRLKICIVDDEKTFATLLKQSLQRKGHVVDTAYTAKSGLEKILAGNFDLIILDMQLPDGSGLDVLKHIRAKRDDCDIVVGTAYGSIEFAVQAMRLGAVDFITKPFHSDDLSLLLDRIIRRKALQKELSIFQAMHRLSEDTRFLPSRADIMKNVYKMALAAAETGSTSILIQGETGVGKGYLANFIHSNSPKASQPMLHLNCAAVPETLIESELFGYQAGAFTGAQKTKKGLLELADGGMLFLDEIGDMNLAAQSKLLQVLESGKFKRIGGLNDITVDIWVVAATNKSLSDAVESGKFRSDLLYRLNVMTLEIPPLRRRKEDLPRYAKHFIDEFSVKLNKDIKGLTEAAMRKLMEYSWPGNLRELRNVMERAVLLTPSGQNISINVLPLSQLDKNETQRLKQESSPMDTFRASGKNLKDYLESIELAILKQTMKDCGGNQSETARRLGIAKHVVKYRMKNLEGN